MHSTFILHHYACSIRLNHFSTQIEQEKLERQNIESKNKITVLQQELGNSEAVQKDFVRLSQSLQVSSRDNN